MKRYRNLRGISLGAISGRLSELYTEATGITVVAYFKLPYSPLIVLAT